MSTLVGFRCADGAVLAGDRSRVEGGRLQSRAQSRVFGFDDWGVAIAGTPVEAVRDQLEASVRTYRTDHGKPPTVEPLSRMAREVVDSTEVELLFACRDTDGKATVGSVTADGAVLTDSPLALGSGASLALGRLESADLELPLADAQELAETVISGVASRDTATIDVVDSWTLVDHS